jgi:hypothetical protein
MSITWKGAMRVALIEALPMPGNGLAENVCEGVMQGQRRA